MDRLSRKTNSKPKARRLFLFVASLSVCVFASLSVCNSALAENRSNPGRMFAADTPTINGVGQPYPRIANVYLLGSVDPADYDELAQYDLVVVGTIWTEEQLNELRLRNPNIKIFMYVCVYALPASPYLANTWETENYNYANNNNLWWRNRNGYIASDWPGAQMINVTSVAPRQGPQGTWRQYIINRVQDLVAARPSLDGIFFDNFWQSISWNQGNLQLDSNEDGYMDTNSQLDAWWQEAMTDIASQTRAGFDLLVPGRLQPLSIMGNNAGQYETWLNGSMYEHFPWIYGMPGEGNNPHGYRWNDIMTRVPSGYLVAPFRQDPYRTMLIAAEWDRTINREPVRNADFERNKRFTIASALMGDGYYSLDGARNCNCHSDLWWEPEYDHDGRQRGYLGYPTGPMYRVANPTGPEIILNGSFSEGLNNWQSQFYNGSVGTVDIDNAEFHSEPASLRVNVTAVPPDSYVKITQSPVSVTYNTAYTLSFWARSDTNQELLVHLYSSSCQNYRCMNDTRYNLTNEWKLYETSFTSTGTAPSGLDVFVSNPGTVWIDDISLREGDSSFYRRDFDKGLVLLNYTNTAQSVSLGGTYKRLSIPGSDVWDGASISSETVPPYDARILLKANHPPELRIIGDTTVNENETLTLTLQASDPDGDSLVLGVSNSPEGSDLSPAGVFTWTPTFTQAGEYSVTFSVSDGTVTVDVPVTLTVNNVNRAPVFPPLWNITMLEGQPLTINLDGSDPDRDPITYSADPLPLPEGADLNPNTGVFTWTPNYDQANSYPITFTVSDEDLSVSRTITITVINVNRAPQLTITGNRTVNEGEILTLTVQASDPDGDDATLGVNNLPGGAQFSQSGIFTWATDYNSAGIYNVTFTASDGQLPVSEMAILTVINVNRPPVLEPISGEPITVYEGEFLTINLIASDPDGDTLTYSAEPLPEGADLNPHTGVFSWAPGFRQAGTYSLTFSASDGDLTVSETIDITVINVNSAPILDAIGSKGINEGQLLTFTIVGYDREGDALRYSAYPLPEGASIDRDRGVFSWTPDYDQAGIYSVKFSIFDGSVTVSEDITITVNNANGPPSLDSMADKIVNEGELLKFTITANDPDGDSLSYNAEGLPAGADFDETTQTFSWTPGFEQAGTYSLVFSASDGDLTVSETMDIAVNNVVLSEAQTSLTSFAGYNNSNRVGLLRRPVLDKQLLGYNNANGPPSLDSMADKIVNEGELLKFTITANDPDGDSLSYNAEGLPAGADFDETTQTFSWIPGFRQAGTYSLTFSASDGDLAVSETMDITVKDTIITVDDVILTEAQIGLTAFAGYDNGIKIGLLWQSVLDKRLLGYNIYKVDTATGVIYSAPINASPIDSTYYSFLVNESVLYKFVVTAVTSDGKESLPLEAVSVYADPVEPSRITDLKVVKVTNSSITLTWTATGDDANVGCATSYDVRYTAIPLTDNPTRWAELGIEVQNEPVPAAAGAVETMTIRSLKSDTTYYFSIRVLDDKGNSSSLSNEVAGKTSKPKAAKAKNKKLKLSR